MQNEITPRETELLDYIIKFKEVNGFSPSYVEMMVGINTKSSSYIDTALNHLEDKGYIVHRYKKSRTITVVRFH